MKLLIVESPAKAKTINKYLGPDYEVIASYGHIRDLPAKNGSVDPDHDFAMTWEIESRGAKQISEIAKAVKGAEKLILATDPDREGEAISWHVIDVLHQKKLLKNIPVERVTFNAITKDAVQTALQQPRKIDQSLVDAYMARRALDYLVGFNLSPVLWRKLPGARSAGRVQSVALRLVCEREQEIETFKSQEYWSLIAQLATATGGIFDARLIGADGKKIGRLDIHSAEEAEQFKKDLELSTFSVTKIEAKPAKRHPFAPFTTSTLQQEASRKLGLAPAQTMRIAQRLYEGVSIGGETVGLITYMRTDGVDMAPEAISQTRHIIEKEYGSPYLPKAPRKYTAKAKNAQEAHEAVRPTDIGRLPQHVSKHLEPEQARLYELIWLRTVASQMESAEFERTTVDILGSVGPRKLDLRATGQVVKFDGFLTLYQEGKDDEEDEENRRLPPMTAGDTLTRKRISANQHFTEPPPRYSEASLVKRMEELGIGRPSTYASVLAVLRDREYVRLEKKRLFAESKGMIVTAFLENYFKRYIEYDFTADLEEKLDRISNSEIPWKQVLTDFWKDFIASINDTTELRISDVLDKLNDFLAPHIFPKREDGSDPRSCPLCKNGSLSLKLGRYGAFIGCSNYPECNYTRQLGITENSDNPEGSSGTKELGQDPETGLMVTLRDGRFGPFVQLGEDKKPKRASLLKGMPPSSVDLETALKLLSLPRVVAEHPETKEPIKAGVGRFGPYVHHGKTYANLDKDDNVLEIGANRAIALIIAKENGISTGQSRTRREPIPGRILGLDPELNVNISVKDGRFGAYITDGKTNVTIPKSLSADTISLDDALPLLTAKRAAAPKAKKTPAKKTATKKTVKKETATEKKAEKKKSPASAKKPTTKKAATTAKPKKDKA